MDMFNNPLAIERAILATYVFVDFYCDIMNRPTLPILSEKLFTIQIHRDIAEKINKAIKEDESISMAGYEIEDKISGTRYETEWLEIIATSPLPIASLQSYFKLLSRIRIKNEHGE